MSETTVARGVQARARQPKSFLLRIGPVYYALVAIFLAGAISQPAFLTLRNIRNILVSVTPWSIATVGQTFVILTAGIDLSVGPVISLTNVIAAFLMKDYPEQAIPIILLCLGVGTAVGLINGLAVYSRALERICMEESFHLKYGYDNVITLATGTMAQGLALEVMYQPSGMVTPGFREVSRGSLGPIPYAVIYLLVLYLVGSYILKRTPYGLSIYAIGGNEASARLSGIRTQRVLLSVYAISGFLAACAGLFIASRIGSGDPLVGEPYALDSITAAVLGGASLFGGIGDLWGGLAGALIIAILSTLLNMNNINPFYHWIIKGAILIGALALDFLRKGRRQ